MSLSGSKRQRSDKQEIDEEEQAPPPKKRRYDINQYPFAMDLVSESESDANDQQRNIDDSDTNNETNNDHNKNNTNNETNNDINIILSDDDQLQNEYLLFQSSNSEPNSEFEKNNPEYSISFDDDDYGISADEQLHYINNNLFFTELETENKIEESDLETENEIQESHLETETETELEHECQLMQNNQQIKRGRGQKRKRGRKRIYKDKQKKNRTHFTNKRKKKNRKRQKWNAKIWQFKIFKAIKNTEYIFRCSNWNQIDENDEIYKQSDIGRMNNKCPHCTAFLFKHELNREKKKRWSWCCANGKIKLPKKLEPPKKLKWLFTSRHEIAKFFQDNIYLINSALRLCTSYMKQKPPKGVGIPKFILSGKVVHSTPDLANLDQLNKFNECRMYTYDPEEQLCNRLKLPFLEKIRSNIKTQILLQELQTLLMQKNWLIQTYQNVYTQYIENNHVTRQIPEFTLKINSNIQPGKNNDHYKRYSLPIDSNNKIATIMEVGENEDVRPNHQQIIITNKKNVSRTMKETCALADPCSFILFHPYGENGYCGDLNKDHGISMRRYYRYQLLERENQFNMFVHGKRLFEAFVTNQYAKIQQNEMNQLKRKQKVLRRDSYNVVKKARETNRNLSELGTRCNILPSTYIGSPRNMQKKYQDALAIMRAFRTKPDIFLTITANPLWPEITNAIKKHKHLTNKDRDDIIARVFKAKVDEITDDLYKKKVLGHIVAYVYTIEFQKRGLPHAHFLLILHPDCKLDNNPELFDSIITAQIPNPETHPRAHKLFAKHMIHGPCQYFKQCLRDGRCIKHFPKQFQKKTISSKDGYPVYQRLSPHEGGHTCKCIFDAEFKVDNRYAVPTNLPLLLKYDCHINVEYCATIASIKYVYKYIYKGSDKAFISILNEQERVVRECDDFIECRYFGAAEACWKIMSFKMGKQYPSVQVLPIHLQDQHTVYFEENDFANNSDNVHTALTQYFANNLEEKDNPLSVEALGTFHDGTIRPHGYELLYHEYPQFYSWKSKKWKRRTPNPKRLKPKISRMHYVNYAEPDRYFLRVLLLNKPGATGFDDLKTINETDGPEETYKEACVKMGLLDDDTQFHLCLEEATGVITNGYHLRQLFATILNTGDVLKPGDLWNDFKDQFTSDIKHQYYKKKLHIDPTNYVYTQQMYNECLFLIEDMLRETKEKAATLAAYGLPTPNRQNRIQQFEQPRIIREELAFDTADQTNVVTKNVRRMNSQQKKAYTQIINAIYPTNEYHEKTKFFFLEAAAGTGKTFVQETIAADVRSRGDICLCNATSGIAATLFENGRTMHSRFKIPLNCNKSSPLTIKKQSVDAQLIRIAKIVMWDEAPMGHKDVLHWVNKQLQDIMGNDQLFGGKVVLLSGHFDQCPPVIPHASKEIIINSSIKRSKLFQHAKILKLVRNERLRKQLRENDLNEEKQKSLLKFAKWIEKVGKDSVLKYKDIDLRAIEIPTEFVMKCKTESEMINQIYHDINQYNADAEYYLNRCILTPLNKSVDSINDKCLDKIENEKEREYKSRDSVGLDDCSALFTEEFLNTREFAGVPQHLLKLKTNIPVMLLRNLDHSRGLCNGTRLIVKELYEHMIECRKLTDPETPIYIPKMTLSPTGLNIGYEFKRKQLPIRVAFAMTINKAQGQTLEKTIIYLPEPVFEHGQLYVAISRVTTPENLKFFLKQTSFQGFNKKHKVYLTKNVVHKALLIKK